MEECSYTVYMHVSPSNKKYIGITKNDPKRRWRNGKGYSGNPYFCKAITKYGWDNISHYILFSNLSKSEAENMEIDLIKKYHTTNREYGYNIENGGNCCGTHSMETRKKISEKSKGNKARLGMKNSKEHIHAMVEGRRKKGYKGSPHSDEAKRKISEANKGKKFTEEHIRHLKESHHSMLGSNNPMYGRKHSEETKKKISEKAKGRECSESLKKIRSENAKKRSVVQIDPFGNIVAEFKSIKEAAIAVDAKPQNIGAVCRGTQNSCRGFFWRYADVDS